MRDAAYGEGLQLKPTQLPKVVRELVRLGWKVEAEGKLYRQPGDLKIAVSSGRGLVRPHGARRLRGPVGRRCPRLLEALRRGETCVVLDDGSLGMLPEEWLKKYGLLARLGDTRGRQPPLRPGPGRRARRPPRVAAGGDLRRRIRQARDELRTFEGVTPAEPPPGFTGELRGYQREGLGWLHFLRQFGFGGCLADDMGLGKTVQVLALLAGRRATGPALVVVPRSLMFNWKQEAARFAPDLRVLDHTGTGRDQTGAGVRRTTTSS